MDMAVYIFQIVMLVSLFLLSEKKEAQFLAHIVLLSQALHEISSYLIVPVIFKFEEVSIAKTYPY